MPEEVLREAAAEMLDWHGSGMSVMEMSHRGREFGSIIETARADVRELLKFLPEYKILFLQGGGLGENAIVPMNLVRSHGAGKQRPDRLHPYRLLVGQVHRMRQRNMPRLTLAATSGR